MSGSSEIRTACRMIGNAFPPPVAKEIGIRIIKQLENESINSRSKKEIS